MRRQVILSLVQDPPRVEDVKCQGPALEDWLTKKNQYETFTDVKGPPRTVTDDSAIAALYKLMPEELFNNLQMQVEEYDDWRDLFDRLQTCASSKVNINTYF